MCTATCAGSLAGTSPVQASQNLRDKFILAAAPVGAGVSRQQELHKTCETNLFLWRRCLAGTSSVSRHAGAAHHKTCGTNLFLSRRCLAGTAFTKPAPKENFGDAARQKECTKIDRQNFSRRNFYRFRLGCFYRQIVHDLEIFIGKSFAARSRFFADGTDVISIEGISREFRRRFFQKN